MSLKGAKQKISPKIHFVGGQEYVVGGKLGRFRWWVKNMLYEG